MNALTVFFGNDKVYSGVFERNTKGISLIDVSSTLDPIILEDIESDTSKKAINQLTRNLTALDTKVEELNVILTNENAFWTVLPGNLEMDKSNLRQLLEIEVRNNFKSFSIEEFKFHIYPYGAKDDDESEMILVIFIKKKIIENCKKALLITGLEINYITTSQISSQNTIEYNYPDTSHLYDLLVNVEEDFCDISLSAGNITFFYDLLNIKDKTELTVQITKEVSKLKSKGLSPSNILVIGSKLDKEFLTMMNNEIDIETKRLNSFRLVRAELDQRLRDYCIRTSHLYAPVVGGVLNSYDKGTTVEF